MVPKKYLVLGAINGSIISLDQLIKFLVCSQLEVGQEFKIIDGFFSLQRVHNSGAAFGLLSSADPSIREPLMFVIPSMLLLAIIFVFTRLSEKNSWVIYSFALIIGGATSNILDRLRLGYVVDFIDLHWTTRFHFPAFNLADLAISFGFFFVFLTILYAKENRAV